MICLITTQLAKDVACRFSNLTQSLQYYGAKHHLLSYYFVMGTLMQATTALLMIVK